MDAAHSRLKTHRRSLRLGEATYTVLSPRPSVESRFATNCVEDAWHISTDATGAQVLARLCWAMAFQRRSHTITVIDSEFLVPNPFDADRSHPIVIVNNEVGPFERDAAAALGAVLPFRSPSEGTVVLQTRGLDIALEDTEAFAKSDDQAAWSESDRTRRWIEGSEGLVVIAAPPLVLKAWAVELSQLGTTSDQGNSWSQAGSPVNEGEVLVLNDFADRVAKAISLREDVFPSSDAQTLTDDEAAQIRPPLESGAPSAD